ncbi:hypothetical protein KPSA1_05039 [Pseudomonas syringae pv. actinidiae]|uniref:Uncharacterized protein n=1 Tax=Pseudomonas syringae pv. actinidiae TaxID=103796 RepID=A0A2V0QLT9_PSESF|nr:hypothetical protein KPSA1_05039 [Pseudomonas syringae pv. actinidiae]
MHPVAQVLYSCLADGPEVYTAQPVWVSPTPSASKPFQAISGESFDF